MTEGQQAPAGWYPQGDEERYWDGTQWTAQTRPLTAPPTYQQSYQHAYQQSYPHAYQPHPHKQSHVLRNVLLGLLLLGILLLGGCLAVVGLFANEVDKAINEELENDKPVAVAEGEAFDHDGFAVAKGWSVVPEDFGGTTIEGLQVTLKDDQEVSSGRSARLTFRLYDGTTVVEEIDCSSNKMQEGETSRMDCYGGGSDETGAWDAIKVSDAW